MAEFPADRQTTPRSTSTDSDHGSKWKTVQDSINVVTHIKHSPRKTSGARKMSDPEACRKMSAGPRETAMI